MSRIVKCLSLTGLQGRTMVKRTIPNKLIQHINILLKPASTLMADSWMPINVKREWSMILLLFLSTRGYKSLLKNINTKQTGSCSPSPLYTCRLIHSSFFQRPGHAIFRELRLWNAFFNFHCLIKYSDCLFFSQITTLNADNPSNWSLNQLYVLLLLTWKYLAVILN